MTHADPAFFGYGSLVNLATHDYPDPRNVTLYGWRRVWRTTTIRDTAFLSVERDPNAQIDGVVAQVPGADWAALDLREAAYSRIDITGDLDAPAPTAIYRVTENLLATSSGGPILLSYLDVVVQGFLQRFGPAGVARFFASTSGWDCGVINDRDQPRYPRAQTLSADEIALVDACLATRVEMEELG